MPWITASKSDRYAVCSGPLVLPLVDRPAGESAHWGTACHSWMETGTIVASDEYPKHQKHLEKKLAQYHREMMWPGAFGGPGSFPGYFEVAFAHNTLTDDVEALYEGTREIKDLWKNAFNDEWEVGTCDYLQVGDDYVWIDDLKTGRELPDCAQQLSWYAACASRLHGRVEPRVTVTHMPRYPVSGPAERYNYEYNERIFETMRELRMVKMGLALPIYRVLPNGGCFYCPARGTCPLLASKASNDNDTTEGESEVAV